MECSYDTVLEKVTHYFPFVRCYEGYALFIYFMHISSYPKRYSAQFTEPLPESFKTRFASENGPLPKNPLWALRGDGCADSII